MPYANTKELPPAVKDKIKSKTRRRQWMHVFNSELANHGDESRAFASAWAATERSGGVNGGKLQRSRSAKKSARRSWPTAEPTSASPNRIAKAASRAALARLGGTTEVAKDANVAKGATAMSETFNLFLPLSKVEKQKDGSVLVSGYASTPSLDLDGEIVSIDAIKKALPGYWTWRNIREMHQPSAVGVAKEANVDGTGLFLTSRITDPVAAQKCLDQVYKGYSVGGKKLAKKGNTITELELVEVSIVDRPANPDCRFNIAKSKKATNGADVGYLVKAAKVTKDPTQNALKKMAQAVEALSKTGPPAARDGFSLPAIPDSPNNSRPNENITRKDNGGVGTDAPQENDKCSAHGVADCKICAAKREFSTEQRQSLASSGAALPDGSFPIENESDLRNAIHAFGRAGDKPRAKKHIIRRAKALGRSDLIPEEWTSKKAQKKSAKKLAKRARLARAELVLSNDLRSAIREPRELSTDDSDIIGFLELIPKGGLEAPDLGGDDFEGLTKLFDEDTKMTQTQNAPPTIEQAVANLIKRAAQPTRAQRLSMAESNLKKANRARKDARDAIEAAHKMHKAAYLAKAATKRDKPDNDEFDHVGAMNKLQKAYGDIAKLSTFLKAAREQLAKVGQRGQEAADAEAGFYTVPPGVKDISRDAIAGAKPGTSGSGGMPPAYPGDGSVYPGKGADGGDLAKFATNGMVPIAVAELVADKLALEKQVDVLSRQPLRTNGQRPYAFDVSKLAGNGHERNADPLTKAIIDSGVNPAALQGSDDTPAWRSATGAVIGTYLLDGGAGQSVLSGDFRGRAGSGSSSGSRS